MNTAKILKWWHFTGMVALAASTVATQVQPLIAAYPRATAICLGISAASMALTSFMNKLANDKVVQAIINDPSSPTPQGFGLPAPVLTGASEQIVKTIEVDNHNATAAVAVAENAKTFAEVVKANETKP